MAERTLRGVEPRIFEVATRLWNFGWGHGGSDDRSDGGASTPRGDVRYRFDATAALVPELDAPPHPEMAPQTWDDAPRRCVAMDREFVAMAAEGEPSTGRRPTSPAISSRIAG